MRIVVPPSVVSLSVGMEAITWAHVNFTSRIIEQLGQTELSLESRQTPLNISHTVLKTLNAIPTAPMYVKFSEVRPHSTQLTVANHVIKSTVSLARLHAAVGVAVTSRPMSGDVMRGSQLLDLSAGRVMKRLGLMLGSQHLSCQPLAWSLLTDRSHEQELLRLPCSAPAQQFILRQDWLATEQARDCYSRAPALCREMLARTLLLALAVPQVYQKDRTHYPEVQREHFAIRQSIP